MSSEDFAVASGGPAADADNPWPGLSAFTEDLAPYFCGRAEETEELFRRVKRKLLTILFGMSGLGKTSLLQAGLYPMLRREGYWPVPIRLDYQPEAPAFDTQVKTALTLAAAEVVCPVSPSSDDSLWEILHRRELDWKDTAGNTLVPVLVFDQFEEVFTLGTAPEVRARRLPFLQELADLIENRPPTSLARKLEDEPERIATILFARQDYRIVLSLREDYLPQVEGLKALAPSIMENRQRLMQMTGAQALAVLLNPGARLVSPEVARQIVAFVGKARATGEMLAADEVDELEVQPAILSLFARQLNDRRKQRGLPEITSALFSESAAGILQGFYEDCLADQPPGVRAFIEEDLLTESGFRESIALEQARKKLQDRGATGTALDELVQRRLLQVEERLGVQRIELTHDVLTEAIARSRTDRRQQELLAAAAEREANLRENLSRQHRRMLAGGLAGAAIFATVSALAIYGWVQQREASRQRDRAFQQKTLALEAINKLTYDLPDKLGKLPGALSIVKDVYQHNLELLDRVLKLEGDSPEAMREKYANYNRMGQTWERLGDTGKAREAYVKGRSIIERLTADDPGNRQWQDDLAVSHGNIGDMLAAQGDQAKALEEYREALSIRQRFAAQDPENAEWQRKLAQALSRVARQLNTQGDLAGASKEQQNAWEIAQRLLAKTPEDADLEAFLAEQQTQLAVLLLIQGDADGAIREQGAALAVYERLARKEPDNIGRQEALAHGHGLLGGMYALKSDSEHAVQEKRLAGEIYGQLATQDPDNARWQKNLALSHLGMGNTLVESDATRALPEFRFALELYEGLAAKDPINANLQTAIAMGHLGIGSGLVQQKKWAEALTEFRAVLAAAEKLATQDPKEVLVVQQTVAMARVAIGAILSEQGDHAQAMKEAQVGLELFRRLAEQDPSNALFQYQVANSGSILAQGFHAQRNYGEACRNFRVSREVLEPLCDRFPNNLLYTNGLRDIYAGIAWSCLLARQPEEAMLGAAKALKMDPTRLGTKMNLAHAYLLTNQFEKAKAIYLENKDVKLPDGRGFAEVVLKDFKDLKEAGVTHPDMTAIEGLFRGRAPGKRK